MPSSNSYVGYDLNLLATAPPPPPTNGNAPNSLQYNPVPPRRSDLESGRPQFYPYTSNATVGSVEPKVVPTTFIPTNTSPPAGKKPFHRTTKGIIMIIAIVLLAAIIGGAVGGTLANKYKGIPVVQSDHTTDSVNNDPSVATSVIRITTTSLPYPITSVIRITTTNGLPSISDSRPSSAVPLP